MNESSAVRELPKGEALRRLPPMLQQYVQYKERYPEALLLFQVGDFYETFFGDAVVISRSLNLTLTSRDKNSPHPIPMAGVPVAVVDNYIERLVAQGFSVALVSQIEPPPGSKGMFERKLERMITPGVRILARSDQDRNEHLLAAVYMEPSPDRAERVEGAIAYSNVQSGQILVRDQITADSLQGEIGRLGVSELLVCRSGPLARRIFQVPWAKGIAIKVRPDEASEVGGGSREFGDLPGYSQLSPHAKRAVRLLLNYVDEATVENAVVVTDISVVREQSVMAIDASTRANLELVRNTRDGGTDGTLFALLDHTKTVSGARRLRRAILNPLLDRDEIGKRLTAVRYFKLEITLRAELFEALRYLTDLERVAARIELRSVMPRELGALRDSVQTIPTLRRLLVASLVENGVPEDTLLRKIVGELEIAPELVTLLTRALCDELPLSASDGGIIRDGFDPEVDRLREIKRSGRSWIADLEAQEKVATGISSLKIKYNNVIGFFFEVTKANAAKVPEHFIRRQSTVTGDRFTTIELQRRESEVLGAEGKLCGIEKDLFEQLRGQIVQFTQDLRKLDAAVGTLDMLLSLAEAADREDLVEPEIVESTDLIVRRGRHPVVARLLKGGFIPNSLSMKEEGKRCFIITGPNMGGKSTFLRQAAIIVIMAQIGSFVSADAATVGIVDRIFARIGASDNLAEGESTFMVEMREAAQIVSSATPRSLLLIDEIGRGTATADGLSLARAILEWFVTESKSRTLFATHYHELTGLEATFPSIGNLSVGSTDIDGQVIFTHQILDGPASKSYGLEVARLAGLPIELITRARTYLDASEEDSSEKRSADSRQLSFFTSVPKVVLKEKIVDPPDYGALTMVRQKLETLSVDDITPRRALDVLSELREHLLTRQNS